MKIKKFYRNLKWIEFSNKIKKRDRFKYLKCGRNSKEVTLQVHHTLYYENRKPWEYSLSDCITLCKGCHAREHDLIEPNYGWTLVSVSDLGDLSGICERKNCNTAIRYEHEAYHPKWGYKTVGSTCIEFLTEEDKFKSRQYIKFYTKIAKALNKFNWENGKTKRGRLFISTKYQKSIIRVYEDNLSYQLAFYMGNNKHDWKKPISYKKVKNIDFIKELALINLIGIIVKEKDKKEELEVLRNIFKNTKNSLEGKN